MARPGVNGTPDRDKESGVSERLLSLATELVAAVAATPEPDRERVIEEIGRVIRSEVKAVDEHARECIYSWALPTRYPGCQT
jgi:hypothetical protein